MKKPSLLLLVIAVLLSCNQNGGGAAGKDELKGVLMDYYGAMATMDIKKMNELTTPDFVLFEDGQIYNNETALKSVEGIGKFSVKFRFDSLNTNTDKANASAYYFREADITIGDSTYPTFRFLESATFKKENNAWKIRFLHSSLRK